MNDGALLQRGNKKQEQLVDGVTPDPGLDAEPAARNNRPKHRRNVCALDAEGCACKHGKSNPEFRPGVRIQNHGNDYDQVAEANSKHRLPPIHPLGNKPARQHIRRDTNRHPDPERRDIPDAPVASGRGDRREVLVEKRASLDLAPFEFGEIGS